VTIEVELPDGTVAEFPDGTANSVIESALKRHFGGKPSTGEDMAKSAAVAVPKALTGILGAPGDVLGLINRGVEWGLSKKFGGAPADYRQPGLQDKVDTSAIRAPLEAVTGKWYEPQTRPGKAIDTAIQAATPMGKGALTKSGLGIIAGTTAGTEGAGAATNDDPIARLFGGLLGGGIPALASGVKSRQGAVIKDAVGDVPEVELAKALALQERAKSLGVPLMGTEALDRGHNLASQVRASSVGSKTVEPFLAQRPAQVQAAVDRDILSKTGPRATPQVNAARAQSAAEGVISGLERDRSALVGPDYLRARNESLSPQAVARAKAELDAAKAKAPASQQADFDPFIRDLSAPNATNAGLLDEIYRRARDSSNLPINASSADKQAAYAAGVARDKLETLTSQSQNLARGRQQYADFTRSEIEPVTSGPVGVVAGKRGVAPGEPSPVSRITSTLGDANTARPETIRDLYKRLNAQDPQAFPGIVQTHIENKLNDALAVNQPGPNPAAGAKFYRAVAGTPQDAANFTEMMRGVAVAHGQNPDQVAKGANVLLEVLDRTGRTPGVGSPTQPRLAVDKELAKTKTGDAMDLISGRPLGWASNRLNDWVMRGRYDELARVLTAPDSVQQLARMAKLKPDGVTAKYMAAQLLGLTKVDDREQ
jgi:hypothetical protein